MDNIIMDWPKTYLKILLDISSVCQASSLSVNRYSEGHNVPA